MTLRATVLVTLAILAVASAWMISPQRQISNTRLHMGVADLLKNALPSQHESSLSEKLLKHFHSQMKSSEVPLFQDFDAYAATLPIRDLGSKEKVGLYTLPFLARDSDLRMMGERFVEQETGAKRQVVKYICSPSESGKSASVLAAFLVTAQESGNGKDIFLYLAFANNGGRKFKCQPWKPNKDHDEAEKQGCLFILGCVQNLLERPFSPNEYIQCTVKIPTDPESLPDETTILKQLQEYLDAKLPGYTRIFFHVDEHRRMCDRSQASGASFSYGALSTLAQIRNAYVIATFTEVPTEIPPIKSSEVCRRGVPLAPLDIDQVMEVVPELHVPRLSNFSADHDRLLASLKLRLYLMFCVGQLDIVRMLHRKHSRKEDEKAFLLLFEKIKSRIVSNKNNPNAIRNALKELNALCEVKPKKLPTSKHAARLLVGLDEENDTADKALLQSERLKMNLVVLPDKRVSASLPWLLGTGDKDPKYEGIYDIGQEMFLRSVQQLGDPGRAHGQQPFEDMLANLPLEAAYLWTLACQSAVHGRIAFTRRTFSFECITIKSSRLFPGTNCYEICENLDLQHGVMYRADECERGKAKHPRADIYFITKRSQLVLVDVTGSLSLDKVKEKIDNLAEWVAWAQENLHKDAGSQFQRLHVSSFIGVVLAPNVLERDVDVGNARNRGVDAVCGEEAVSALGGLGKVAQYYTVPGNTRDQINS